MLCPEFFFLLLECFFPFLLPFSLSLRHVCEVSCSFLQRLCKQAACCCPPPHPQMYHAVKLPWVNRKPSKCSFQLLKMPPLCMRLEKSCELSRDCHISVDLFDGFSRISARRGRDVSSGKKVLAQVYIKTFRDLQIKCEIWIFRMKVYIHNPVLVSASQGLFLLL